MAWKDRPHYRDRGYHSNPLSVLLTGSVPLFRILGVRVRAHSVLILFFLCQLLLVWSDGYTLVNKLTSMAMFLAAIVLHECGHCLAARWVGGWSDEVILWPLGGLAFPETPQRPGARFWTVAGGPLANLLGCAVGAAAVWFLGGHTGVSFNPFRPLPPPELQWHGIALCFWWLFATSYILLLLTMLPIYPLDGGQMIQTALWKALGSYRSGMIVCPMGMVGSVLLAVLALVRWDSTTLIFVVLAAWLFHSCYQQRMILHEAGLGEPWQGEETNYTSSPYRDARTGRRLGKRAIRIARKRARLQLAEQQRLDAILAKVSAQGLSSLNWHERRALRIATEQRRKHESEINSFLQD